MKIRREDCDHCIWRHRQKESCLQICRMRNCTLLQLFWRHKEIECNYYEAFRYSTIEEG